MEWIVSTVSTLKSSQPTQTSEIAEISFSSLNIFFSSSFLFFCFQIECSMFSWGHTCRGGLSLDRGGGLRSGWRRGWRSSKGGVSQ